MSGVDVGKADMFFDIRVPKLMGKELRQALQAACLNKINEIAPREVRDSWIQVPYGGGADPAALLQHGQDLISKHNSGLGLATPIEVPYDHYCYWCGYVTCYGTFEPTINGERIDVTASAGGLTQTCRVLAIITTSVPE